MTSVVLVTDRHSVRNTLLPALADAGYDITTCVGPQAPDYMCLGSRCGLCPLAERAAAVVLDTDVSGDRVGAGTTADDLIRLYGRMRRPVVVLADAVRRNRWQGDPDIQVLPAEAGPRSVLRATAQAVARHPLGRADQDEAEELAGPKRWVEGTTIAVGDL